MPTPASQLDQVLATTLANYRKKLVDNVFLQNPLLWFLTEKNRVRYVSGGHKIVEHLIYADGQAGSYGEWEPITIEPQEGLGTAEYDWKQLYATIAISGLQEAVNSGKEQMLNLLKAKLMQAEKTLKKQLNAMLWSDGSGNAGKDFDGLAHLIGQNATAVGGIDPVTETWWATPQHNAAITGGSGTDTYDELRAVLTTLYNDVSDGPDTIDALFFEQSVYEMYEAGLAPNVRYEDVAAANAGFTTLRFKQGPIFWDKGMTAGDVYGINTEYMGLVGHKNRWFKQSKFSPGLGGDAAATEAQAVAGEASTIDARYAVISTFGNLTVSNRSKHFRITGVGAA